MTPMLRLLPIALCFLLMALPASADDSVPPPSEYLDFIQSLGPEDPEYTDTTPSWNPEISDPYADSEADSSDETLEETQTQPEETETTPEEEPEETEAPTFESQDSIQETQVPTETVEPTEVTEETQDPDDFSLQQLAESMRNTETATQYIAGFCLFFVVCALCFFSYKFFKIFF